MATASLLGMAMIYSEAFLAVRFREQRADGSFMGGPMGCISKGLNVTWLGLIFAGGGAFAALSTGNMIQSDSMTDVAIQLFDLPRWIYGVGIAGLVGAVRFGYSTLIGWAYYGEQCSRYLLGDRSVNFYRIIFVLCVAAGAVLSNVFMIVPNLVGVIGLSALVARETTPYLDKLVATS